MEAPGRRIAAGYDPQRVVLAVPGSHSALQLLRGALDEGVPAVLVATRRLYEGIYRRFPWLYTRALVLDSWGELASPAVVEKLRGMNAVLVPHGSLVEYLGWRRLMELELPILGNRWLLRIEADQAAKMRLLHEAGIETPRVIREPGEATGPVIVKLPGAKGGRGYRLATPETLPRVLEELESLGYRRVELIIQEYLVGVRLYSHYFQSTVYGRVELLGMDYRYESNVDGLPRLPPRLVEELGLEPSFTVVANAPLVARESLLATVLRYGEAFAEAVEKETGLPPLGPYSLEGVVGEDLGYRVFEFSGRIVAGTNVYTGTGSPYSWLYWSEPMYMGRRIARELRIAKEKGMVGEIVS